MKAQSTGPNLCAVFVDYDNVYMSLKRRSEEAAKRFAKDAGLWLREIESGRLITATNGTSLGAQRRIVLNRCYGNPVPRRNASDNSTDMNSFPFVRHHFLRAGFEAIDCPPLTSQLKNSADIKMVLDIGDMLNHDTYFDEFIILSGDADFTHVLHRLRAHARRTVVFATDNTAAPYTAISDGEVREADLAALLLDGRLVGEGEPRPALDPRSTSTAQLEAMRKEIVAEVAASVRSASRPLPLEALADRAVRALGHDKTVGSAWGGAGSFRDLLAKGLPNDVRLSDQPPYFAFDASRQLVTDGALRAEAPGDPRDGRYEPRPELAREPRIEPPRDTRALASQALAQPVMPRPPIRDYQQAPAYAPVQPAPALPAYAYAPAGPERTQPPRAPAAPQAPARPSDTATALQQSIARIHEACQAPPLSPPEYRVLFEMMAEEINTNNLAGAQTLINIVQRARDMGIEVRRDDVRFVLEVVSEADPWFEQGASANLFASRFRNFVVARCRSQGLSLSSDELDLIDAWFGGPQQPQRGAPAPSPADRAQAMQSPLPPAPHVNRADRWTGFDDGRQLPADARGPSGFAAQQDEEFPRIVRTRYSRG